MTREHEVGLDIKIVDYFVVSGNRLAGPTDISKALRVSSSGVRNQLWRDRSKKKQKAQHPNTLFARGLVKKWGDQARLTPKTWAVIDIMLTYYFPLRNRTQPRSVYLGKKKDSEISDYWRGSEESTELNREAMFLRSAYADVLFSPDGFLFPASFALGHWFCHLGDKVHRAIGDLLPPEYYKKDSILGLINILVLKSSQMNQTWEHVERIQADPSIVGRIREKMVSAELLKSQKAVRGLIASSLLIFRTTQSQSMNPKTPVAWTFMDPSLFTMLARYSRLSPTLMKLLLQPFGNLADVPLFQYQATELVFERLRKKAEQHDLNLESEFATAIRAELVETIRTQFVLHILDLFQSFLKADAFVVEKDLIKELTNDQLTMKKFGIKGGLPAMNAYLADKTRFYASEMSRVPRERARGRPRRKQGTYGALRGNTP